MENRTYRRNRVVGCVLRPLRGEGGFLLVIAMLIMLAVSTIAAANLINAMLERNLARNQNYSSLALQAAEAGIADGLAWVNANVGTIPDHTVVGNRGWSQTISARDLSRDLNGDGDTGDEGERLGKYTVRVHFKREWNDYTGVDANGDGDFTDAGDTAMNNICKEAGEVGENHDTDGDVDDCNDAEVVINNRCNGANGCFNFPDSIYAGPDTNADPFERGYPVIQIDSVGAYGDAGFRRVLMDVTRDLLVFNGLKGAVTAEGGADFGSSTAKKFNGKTHKLDGTLGWTNPACADAEVSDAFYETGKDVGTPKAANFPNDGGPTQNNTGETLCTTPWCPFGLDTQAQLEAMAGGVYNAVSNPSGGVFSITGSADPAKAATDALVEAAMANGKIVYYKNNGAVFDPPDPVTGILALEGTYRLRGGGDLKGLLVAKGFDLNGNAEVTGAVIQYDANTIGSYANGNTNFLYSCDVLMDAKKKMPGLYTNKLAWHRLR